jgi:hypothetical protein
MTDPQITGAEQQVFVEITTLTEEFIKPYFQAKLAAGEDAATTLLHIGRALLLTGVNMIGNAGDLNDVQALRIGQVCLEKLHKAINNKRPGEEN